MIKGIKEGLKELPPEVQEAHAKDKKNVTVSTTAITTTALGSAAIEWVNESLLPAEWVASAGSFGFILWGVVKVLMIEAESGLEHLLE